MSTVAHQRAGAPPGRRALLVRTVRTSADTLSLKTPRLHHRTEADVLARWQNRQAETKRNRTDRSFLVPKAEIAGNDYDLSINRYKEVEYDAVAIGQPFRILLWMA